MIINRYPIQKASQRLLFRTLSQYRRPTSYGWWQLALILAIVNSSAWAQCFSPAASGRYTVGDYPGPVVVGDFNGDGKADIATANTPRDNNTVSVLLGTSTSSFGAAINYEVGRVPYSMTVGDFNEDGKDDLVTANKDDNTVSLLLSAGTGSFGASISLAVGIAPYSVAVGDFNGDDHLDIATANTGSATVSVLLGTGTGSFGAALSFLVGMRPYAVEVGDFDGNGLDDLVVTNYDGYTALVLLSTGMGNFDVGPLLDIGCYASLMTVADLNGDGKADLAASDGNNIISVLLGTGMGDFGSATPFETISALSLVVADFNGDSKVDLAVSNPGLHTVSVLLGTGTGSFGEATSFGVDRSPLSVAVGDFNEDGKADLVSANAGDNTITVLLNCTSSTPDLTPVLYARPSSTYNTKPISVVVEVYELNGAPTHGPIVVKLNKDPKTSLTFSAGANSVGGITVNNSAWSFDSDSDEDYYILTANQPIAAGDVLAFGLTGSLTPGATSGSLTFTGVLGPGSGGEVLITNNSDADKIDFFQQ